MDEGWRQQWLAMHFGDKLQINDFGYLQRNNLNYGHWEVRSASRICRRTRIQLPWLAVPHDGSTTTTA